MVKSTSVIVLIFALFGLPASGQTSTGNAATKGTCSPATTGSNNNFVIQCGIGQEQGKKIIDMLNAALASRDDSTINAKLDELLAAASKPLQPISLSASLRIPSDLAISVENRSDRIAKDISWEVVLYRESDLAMFSFATQSIGYVKAFSKGSYYTMKLETLPKEAQGDGQMKKGDVFTGCVVVDCPECRGVAYIVHLVWGQSGWFYEATGLPSLGSLDGSLDGKRQWIKLLNDRAPANERVPIL
jgi:hypothetical protein